MWVSISLTGKVFNHQIRYLKCEWHNLKFSKKEQNDINNRKEQNDINNRDNMIQNYYVLLSWVFMANLYWCQWL